MIYKRIAPRSAEGLVECFWFMEDNDVLPQDQKIIPDGFTEVIIHRGDPYRILISEQWEVQEKMLVAGQITGHFSLGNTGTTSIAAIKFRPTALSQLFGLDMRTLTNRVLPIQTILPGFAVLLKGCILQGSDDEETAGRLEQLIEDLGVEKNETRLVDAAISLIISSKGAMTVQDLCRQLDIGERQMERGFNKFVGISPKRYARIIRFNHIFDQVKNGADWLTVTERAGFHDQPHFIRDFKAFTGEDPSSYRFSERNMANFFVNRIQDT